MEAYKRKGISSWAWLIITLLWAGILIAGLKSCAEAGETVRRDARGEIPAPAAVWKSNAYAEWSKLDLNDPNFMVKQRRQIVRWVSSMAPTRFREILLAIGYIESGYTQFDQDGNPTSDPVRYGHTHGAMRISDQPWARYDWIDYERIKWDAKYNAECGILIFLDKWRTAKRLKDERPGLIKVSRTQVAIQLYWGLLPLRPGIDRWEYSRLIFKTMREKPWERYLE